MEGKDLEAHALVGRQMTASRRAPPTVRSTKRAYPTATGSATMK